MLLFGHGGTAVEVINDPGAGAAAVQYARLPHRELMSRTRIHRLLEGYRRRSGPTSSIAATLVKISQLVIDLAEIEELDINPLLADGAGVIALDVRIQSGAI